MKASKRILAILLTLALALSLLPTAFAIPAEEAAAGSAAKAEGKTAVSPVQTPHRYGTVYYETSFEDPPATEGWTFLDMDGDSEGWMWKQSNQQFPPYYGDGVLASESWNSVSGALSPDNVAISPAITLPSTGQVFVSLRAACTMGSFPENFAMYIGTSTDVYTMTKLHIDDFLTQEQYREFGADLTPYAGKTVYIAIRHYDSVDNSALLIDDFRVAQSDYYALAIDGIAVSDCNKFDVLHNGVFRFDADYCTLYVSGDYTTASADDVIRNGIDGLEICVEDDSTLHCWASGIYADSAYTYVTGPGKLTIQTDDYAGVYVKNATFSAYNASLEIDATYCGILADPGAEPEQLMITHSDVKAKGSPAAIGPDFSEILLEDCEIKSPTGALIKPDGIYAADGSTPATEVEIQAYPVYDLYIDGERVTEKNYSDVKGDGVFAFDPDTNTLHLHGSYTTDGYLIMSMIEGLTIQVDADTVLKGGSTGFELYNKTVITGPGKLSVQAEYVGIYVASEAMLEINNATLNVDGGIGYGITGSMNEYLYIDSSNVVAKGGYAAINDFSYINVAYCEFLNPDGAVNTGAEIQDGLGNTATEVELRAIVNYPIWIAGVKITENNQTDVLGNGAFAYDPAANTLYVNDDCTTEAGVINSQCDGLTIHIGSNVTLESKEESAIQLMADTRITGLGCLTVKAPTCCILVGNGAKLTLDICQIDAIGGSYGICGAPSGESLYVTNSIVHATGTAGAICDFDGGIQLVGMDIVKPEGGILAVDEIQNADESRATEVKLEAQPIEVYEIWVKGVQVSELNAADVLGDGVFSFDPSTSTLTVRGKAEADTGSVITTAFGSLKICVEEDSLLVSHSDPALWLANFTTITGPGLLKLRSENQCVHVSAPVVLFLNDARIDAVAEYAGSICGDNSGQKLIVTHSQVHASADITAIGGFDGGITLDDCEIQTPDGGTLGASAVLYANDSPAEEVQLNYSYAVYFDINGHGEAVAEARVFAGATVVKPADPQEDGWVFGGWYTEAECTNAYDFSTPVNGVLVLYAKWTQKPDDQANPFVDVFEKDFFYTPVLWAYYSVPQVTTGVNANHFGPNNTCTRGQIVTFLWRAKGCPEPSATESPFDDVQNPKAFYYKAVLWAVEKGVTTGIDKTHFGPDKGCTRGQVVAFLWRAEDKPAPSTTTSPFEDVQNTKAFYYDAVLWAVEKGITKGVDKTHFGPDKTCTRGQIVTFLYRDVVG